MFIYLLCLTAALLCYTGFQNQSLISLIRSIFSPCSTCCFGLGFSTTKPTCRNTSKDLGHNSRTSFFVERGEPCFLPSHTTIFHIKTAFCLPSLVCATPQFHRLHFCNRVQPCATTMLRAVRAVLQKNEETIQCEHIWSMHYKSHITQAKTHPPSLESHVITTMEPHFKESLSHHGRQACPRCNLVAYNSIAFPTPTRRSMQMICIEEDAGSCIDQASPYKSLPPMCPCTGLDLLPPPNDPS